MFKIIEKRDLVPGIFMMKVQAPRVASAAQPGQFVMVRVSEQGERIPLTIADYDRQLGWVSIVIQAIGASTCKMYALNVGDSFASFTGPLGRPADFIELSAEELAGKRYLFIAGGLGTAPVYPQVKWLHERGIKADVIIGAKNKQMLIMTDQMREVAGSVYIATDDGSEGYCGLVTGLFEELVGKQGKQYDEVITIGPMIMMKFVALATKKYDIHTIASLNALMVDGTGMCGACRITVGGRTRFACVDGPEFDAHQVDFDEAMRRQGMYKTTEERKAKIEQERLGGHICKIGLGQ